MITENELQQLQTETLERAILRVVSDNEPVKKHAIPDFGMASWSRNEIFTQIAQMKEQKLLDIGDVEEGFIVMLTPEGRALYRELTQGIELPEEKAPHLPEKKNEHITRVGRILEIVEANPGIEYRDLADILGIDAGDKKSYSCMTSQISQLELKRGLVHRKKDGFKVYVFPGRAPIQKPKSASKPAPKPEVGLKVIDTPEAEKQAIDEARERGETQLLPSGGITAEPEKEACSRFRVARTSDKTLILWGLSPQPIELNPADSVTLIDFILDEG